MEISPAAPNQFAQDIMEQMYSSRHKVFVEMLHWPLNASHGIEFDQYDVPDTFYVVARNTYVGVKRHLKRTGYPCTQSRSAYIG